MDNEMQVLIPSVSRPLGASLTRTAINLAVAIWICKLCSPPIPKERWATPTFRALVSTRERPFLPLLSEPTPYPLSPPFRDLILGRGAGTSCITGVGDLPCYNLINPKTEAESVANSSQSLASSYVAVQDPQTLTCSESALMSRGQIKHKSLVTYTTALGSGTSSRRAKTVISMTVLGSGAKTTQYAASLLSKATGGQEGRSAFGEGQQDDGLQTPFAGGEKDRSFSDGVRGVACLTYLKSWLDKCKDCFGNSTSVWMGLEHPRLCKTLTFGTILLHCEVQLLTTQFKTLWLTDDTMWIDAREGKLWWDIDLKRYWREFICHYLTKSFNLETK